MKVIHGSLQGLLQEVKDKKGDAVRIAGFVQSDVVADGIPRYTAWVVVTAHLDWDLWTEWRLLVGRGYAERTETGAVVPARIAERLAERGKEVRARVAHHGSVPHGIGAGPHDHEVGGGKCGIGSGCSLRARRTGRVRRSEARAGAWTLI
jgi:hypothetical protein